MFYHVVVNDWGETTYVPTTLGNILLAVLIVVLLCVAMLLAEKHTVNQKKISIKQLTFCAMAIALATVLSNVRLFHFPTGGSITLLSMLVVCLPGYFFGLGAGILAGISYGILQLAIDPYVLFPMQLVMDYVLAFGALGLSGIFHNAKQGLIKGYAVGVLGRYVFAVLSGWIFFGTYAWEGWNSFAYSAVYNAIYIFSEAAITIIIIVLPPVSKALKAIKKMAVE